MASIALGVILTEENGGMPLILSRITDRPTLLSVVRGAVADAEKRGRATANNPFISRGHREQAAVLREVLDSLQSGPGGPPAFRQRD